MRSGYILGILCLMSVCSYLESFSSKQIPFLQAPKTLSSMTTITCFSRLSRGSCHFQISCVSLLKQIWHICLLQFNSFGSQVLQLLLPFWFQYIFMSEWSCVLLLRWLTTDSQSYKLCPVNIFFFALRVLLIQEEMSTCFYLLLFWRCCFLIRLVYLVIFVPCFILINKTVLLSSKKRFGCLGFGVALIDFLFYTISGGY